MAPDLNTISPPLRTDVPSTTAPRSRRPSQLSTIPPLPLGSPTGTLPTHPVPIPAQTSPSMTSTTATDSGGPVRHPRPLTAAELHLELEKEQEAVVNRLTRELTLLRAHSSASIASSTSSVSTAPPFDTTQDSHAQNTTAPLSTISSGSSLSARDSTPSLRHRSSSNLSNRSSRSHSATGGITALPLSHTSTISPPAPLSGVSQASVDRTRDATGGAAGVTARGRSASHSRQNSIVIPHRSGAPSPSLVGAAGSFGSYPHHGYYNSTTATSTSATTGPLPVRSPSHTRLDEVAQARGSLDAARAENEILAERVRQLERALRSVRDSTKPTSPSVAPSANVATSSSQEIGSV